jgi:hypothetical protein
MQLQPFSVLVGVIADTRLVRWALVLAALVWGVAKGAWWAARHPKYSVPFLVAFAGFIHFWSWDRGLIDAFLYSASAGVVCGFATAVGFGWWHLYQLLRNSEIDSWKKLFRGLPRLISVHRDWDFQIGKMRPKLEIDGNGPVFFAPTITHTGITGLVDTSVIGRHSSGLKQYESDLASAFRCDRVLFDSVNPHLSEVRLDWGRHLSGVLSLADVPSASASSDWPANIGFGLTESGAVAQVAANESLLVGGITGSGKSSFAWAYIAGWIRSGIPFRLRVCDGSGMEFVELKKQLEAKGIVHDYVDGSSKDALEEFFKRAEKALDTRMAWCRKRDVRLFIPTVEHPADILIIDETIPISESLRDQGTEHPICRIAYLGRKASQIAVMLTQAGQKNVMGQIRDFFPRRISFRTGNRFLTEVVLGEGCEKEGAACSALHEKHDRGVGCLAQGGGYVKFRTPWISDEQTKAIASGVLPEVESAGALNDLPTSLYRLWGEDSVLLYVGIAVTGREEARWAEHSRSKSWWHEVVEKTVEEFPDRREAADAEMIAIKSEKPVHNVVHNASGRGLNAYMKRLGNKTRQDL